MLIEISKVFEQPAASPLLKRNFSKSLPRKLSHPIQSKSPVAKLENESIPKFAAQEYIIKKRNQINEALKEAIQSKEHAPLLDEAIRYTLLAEGDRIYPTICMASCEAVGGNESIALSTACAFEMLSVMRFARDDLPCLKNNDLRFGKPANHKAFGEGTTTLTCLSLLCLAFGQIASNAKRSVSSDKIARAIEEMSVGGATAGQGLGGKFVEAGVVCGAILGGGSEVEIRKLRNYGRLVGLAGQVCDDVEMGRGLVDRACLELSCLDPTKSAPLYHLVHFVLSQCR